MIFLIYYTYEITSFIFLGCAQPCKRVIVDVVVLSLTVIWQLISSFHQSSGSHLAFIRQSSGNHPAVIYQSSASHLPVICQSSAGSRPSVIPQSSASQLPVICQSSSSNHTVIKYFIHS
jgi:hypothetical protein